MLASKQRPLAATCGNLVVVERAVNVPQQRTAKDQADDGGESVPIVCEAIHGNSNIKREQREEHPMRESRFFGERCHVIKTQTGHPLGQMSVPHNRICSFSSRIRQKVRAGTGRPHNSLKVGQKGAFENYPVVHWFNRARTSLPESPWPGVASACAIASSSAANRRGSLSSHSLTPCWRCSFSTNAPHDFKARRRSSSGPNWSNSASISAKLIADLR